MEYKETVSSKLESLQDRAPITADGSGTHLSKTLREGVGEPDHHPNLELLGRALPRVNHRP